MYLCLCEYMHVSSGVLKARSQTHWILMELELQSVVSHLTWVLETELRLSVGQYMILTCAVFSVPWVILFT